MSQNNCQVAASRVSVLCFRIVLARVECGGSHRNNVFFTNWLPDITNNEMRSAADTELPEVLKNYQKATQALGDGNRLDKTRS